MKLLPHLLASAVCVAVLAATTDAAQATDMNLRGLEANYDQADLYPSPEETADETITDDEEYQREPALEADDPLADEDVLDDESELYPAVYGANGEDAEDTDEDETSFEHDQLDSTRHLRSLADATLAVKIQLASLKPPEEKVTLHRLQAEVVRTMGTSAT
jgi:hypothetical protein